MEHLQQEVEEGEQEQVVLVERQVPSQEQEVLPELEEVVGELGHRSAPFGLESELVVAGKLRYTVAAAAVVVEVGHHCRCSHYVVPHTGRWVDLSCWSCGDHPTV